MPTYEYQCNDCDYLFEEFHSITADPLTDCPSCKTGKVRRLISGGAGILFKGSGFYVNDYKNSGRKEGANNSDSSSSAATKTAESADSSNSAANQASENRSGSSSTES